MHVHTHTDVQMYTLGLSDSKSNAIMMIEIVGFTIMNIIMHMMVGFVWISSIYQLIYTTIKAN